MMLQILSDIPWLPPNCFVHIPNSEIIKFLRVPKVSIKIKYVICRYVHKTKFIQFRNKKHTSINDILCFNHKAISLLVVIKYLITKILRIKPVFFPNSYLVYIRLCILFKSHFKLAFLNSHIHMAFRNEIWNELEDIGYESYKQLSVTLYSVPGALPQTSTSLESKIFNLLFGL